MPAELITIHTDGACSGNPGPGGFAAIIQSDRRPEQVITGGDPDTTNNKMEMAAVIEALRVINSEAMVEDARIQVRSDSQYVTNGFNQNWLRNWVRNNWRNGRGQPVANKDLWLQLMTEAKHLNVQWVWVRGHSGDPMNERCDRLAVQEAENSREMPGYWCSTGLPRTEGSPVAPPQQQVPLMPEDVQAPEPGPEAELRPHPDCGAPADPGTEALRLLEALARLIEEHDDFPTFRQDARHLFANARW